ncbi:MAG: CinA family protein [Thermodesulfobacteriota bacterium]|nr:CinA family protein [Thermodesulfobacteriota bacterium]
MKEESLEKEVASLLVLLNKTVAVAESCTGGLICHRLTNVSGSSDCLEMGVVTYSNQSKITLLGVPKGIIQEHGAVSAACVQAMARGVKELAGTDLGLAVSGIAGPTGGSVDKPVGTVHLALAWNDHVQCWSHLFQGSRGEIKEQASEEGLMRIRGLCQSLKNGRQD